MNTAVEAVPVEATEPCSCQRCVSDCKNRPGWLSIEDAIILMEKGYAMDLSRDWLTPSTELDNDDNIYVLAAACKGYEGKEAPEGYGTYFMPFHKGFCTHLTADDLCALHDIHKPWQCRSTLACGEDTHRPDNYDVARVWNTDEGRALIAAWEKEVKFGEDR